MKMIQGNGYFCHEPIVTDNSYIGWGYENGIAKIITKPHPRISVGCNYVFYI